MLSAAAPEDDAKNADDVSDAEKQLLESKKQLKLVIVDIRKRVKDSRERLSLHQINQRQADAKIEYQDDEKAVAEIELTFQALIIFSTLLSNFKNGLPKVQMVDQLSQAGVADQLSACLSFERQFKSIDSTVTLGLQTIDIHLTTVIGCASDRVKQKAEAAAKAMEDAQNAARENEAKRVVDEKDKLIKDLAEKRALMETKVKARADHLDALPGLQASIETLLNKIPPVSAEDKHKLQRYWKALRGCAQTLTGLYSQHNKTLAEIDVNFVNVLDDKPEKFLPRILFLIRSAYSLLELQMKSAEKIVAEIKLIDDFVLSLNAKEEKHEVINPPNIPLWVEPLEEVSALARQKNPVIFEMLQKNEGTFTLETFSVKGDYPFSTLLPSIKNHKEKLSKKKLYNKTWHDDKTGFVDCLLKLHFLDLSDLKEKVGLLKQLFPRYNAGLHSQLSMLVTGLEFSIGSVEAPVSAPPVAPGA